MFLKLEEDSMSETHKFNILGTRGTYSDAGGAHCLRTIVEIVNYVKIKKKTDCS